MKHQYTPSKRFSDFSFLYRRPALRYSLCVLCVLCGELFSSPTHAQNIGINPTGSAPDPSAGLDVDFTDKGILIPRVSLQSATDVTTISGTEATGLLVYNTNASMTGGNGTGFYYWNGSVWVTVFTNSNSGHGKQKYTANGTFTTPAGVTTVWVSMCGGGGGGGGGGTSGNSGGGGGGAHAVIAEQITVTASTAYAITVGAGGVGGAVSGPGSIGGTSSFGALLSTAGGGGGGGAVSGNLGGGGAAGGTGGSNGFDGSDNNTTGSHVTGIGGGSIFGPSANANSPSSGRGYGGGGAGGSPNNPGFAGAPGFVLVEW